MASDDIEIENIISLVKSELVDSRGNPIQSNIIRSANALPLLSNGYYYHNLNATEKLIPPLSLEKLLDAPVAVVANMKIQPGDSSFLFWFEISSFLPLVSACLGPLANMISIVGLAESWRIDKATGGIIDDPGYIRALNSVSLFFGLVGNFSLLVNFTNTKSYIISQLISIISWSLASLLLLIAIVLFNEHVMNSTFERSEGHWLSVFTVAFYALCTVTMSVNLLGFKLGKYPPILNLNSKEKALMYYTGILAIWLIVGVVACNFLLENVGYGTALYYCVVSILTIGLGDILPRSNGAKAFTLIFSLVGVILMGLIVAMIRQVLHNTHQPVVLWHNIEIRRRKLLHLIDKNKIEVSSEESFAIMRRISHECELEQRTIALLKALFLFMIFWLIGAVIFKYAEDWVYFDGVYFCLLCLITIGYGDFVPKTPLGRVIFISWAIAAVPLMTSLISNIGDSIFSAKSALETLKQVEQEGISFFRLSTKVFRRKKIKKAILSGGIHDALHVSETTINEPLNSDTTAQEFEDRIEKRIIGQRKELVGVLDFVNQLKPIVADTVESPSMKYDHDDWSKLVQLLEQNTASNPDLYWLSDESPLRLPLREPNYFISRIFFKIEQDLIKLIKDSDDALVDYSARQKRKSQ